MESDRKESGSLKRIRHRGLQYSGQMGVFDGTLCPETRNESRGYEKALGDLRIEFGQSQVNPKASR